MIFLRSSARVSKRPLSILSRPAHDFQSSIRWNSTTASPAPGQSAPDTKQSDQPNEDKVKAELEAIRKELADSKTKLLEEQEKVRDVKDKYLRHLADTENVRRRGLKDLEDAKVYAISSFAKDLLETLDNLNWAAENSKAKALDGTNEDLKTLYDGVLLTQTTLQKSFANFGITKMESLGKKFNPNLHMGLFMFEDPTKEPGTVGQVLKEGYLLKDRVLRPANVGTVKAPAPPAPPATDSKSN